MRTTCSSLILMGLAMCGLATAAGETPSTWRVGPAAWSFRKFSFFEAVDKTASLGLTCIEAFEGQKVKPGSDTPLNAALSDDAIKEIRAKLDEAKVTLTSIYIHNIPGEPEACRQTFTFAKKLGVGFIVSEPAPESLDLIEKHCDQFDISVAIHNHPEGKSRYWNPDEVLRICEGRGPHIGACGDTGHWLRSGLKPADCIRKLGKRIISLHLKDLDKAAPDGTDRPWGQGCGELEQVLNALKELDVNPALFAVEYESHWDNNMPQIRQCAEWFGKTAP